MRESQYGEHVRILEHFAGRVGKFLDVGAYDGVTFSNTRYLAELGWSGVLVEPSPMAFPHLMAYYKDNPRMELVNAGLTNSAGLRVRKFYANGVGAAGDALSSFRLEHREKFSMHPFEPIWLPVMTWDDLLAALPGPYQFVNIDVEGMNLEVLQGLCLQIAQRWIGPEMVCVELDPVNETEWFKRELRGAGLSHQEVIGGNLLAWK